MTSINLNQQQLAVHRRLTFDFPYFAQHCLVIRLKGGGIAPFTLNKAQMYLHERAEAQLKRTGKVRLIVLKGRQQGISTYIGGRLYHRATRTPDRNVFILSHISSTTESLFRMVDTYHEQCPEPVRPKCLINNNRRMRFDNGSQYTVGTAGSGSVGRGDTNQYFHGSEVAFYENVEDISTGVLQTIADMPGTEIFLESTANGIGNFFYSACMSALNQDEGDQYELVFIPWYWQDEYRTATPPDFSLTPEEEQLKQMYKLDDQQIYWRRQKVADFKKTGYGNGDRKFKQEYPFTVQEAFQASGESLFDMERVSAARKSKLVNTTAPLILGVDPARTSDRITITWRRGNHWIKTETFRGLEPTELAGKLATRFKQNPDIRKCFIDMAEGGGVVSILKEMGWGDIVQGVSFANSPDEGDRYLNKRAEMYGRARDWFLDEAGVRIPDEEAIAVDMGAIPEFKETSSGLLQLPAKDIIKKKLGFSPDIADSFALTFFQFVRADAARERVVKKAGGQKSELIAVNRHRKHRSRTQPNEYFSDEPGWRRRR